MKKQILLADDELTFLETFATVLQEEGMSVKAVTNGTDAIEAIQKDAYDVAILDIQMPGADGIKVLRSIMEKRPETRVIMITAYGSVEMAVEAIKLGACDYVMKPVLFEDILTKIQQQMQFKGLEEENIKLKSELQGKFGLQNIIGRCPSMKSVFDTVTKVAQTKSNVLIVGESGTGKELIARAIHSLGPTQNGRFIGINCSAIPEALFESELFGHKKGSFTSAVEDKKGLFEVADGGTLFLDEIGHMPTNCQVKLLRAIEERQVFPVGNTEPISVNLKIVAATNKNPLEEIKAGRFREDLYYRLNVVGIYLPPLCQRKEDIPLLVDRFIKRYSTEMGKNCKGLTSETMQIFMNYDWKGNIRELQNVIERAMIFAEEDHIRPSDIGLTVPTSQDFTTQGDNLQEVLKISERAHLSQVLSKYKRDKAAAAKALGLGLSSLYRKINELGINYEAPIPQRSTQQKVSEKRF